MILLIEIRKRDGTILVSQISIMSQKKREHWEKIVVEHNEN